jgi:transcriptional regulator with XRE-family HTH domain
MESENDTGTCALPRHVTVNQVVAWNIAWLRREAGLTQLELAARLGWPQNKISEAERSWSGKRTREFDAHTLVGLAVALGVPVPAFLLPPSGDGTEGYVIRLPGQAVDLDMAGLLAVSLTDTDSKSDAMASYRRRLLAAVGNYLGEDWMREVAGWLKRIIGREAMKEGAFRLRGIASALAAGQIQVRALADVLGEAAGEDDE